MDCHTAEGMINEFIAGTLREKDLENFIQHIETCTSCYDELETYFIVNEAAKQLNLEEDELGYDFKGRLAAEIKKTKVQIRKDKFVMHSALLITGVAVVTMLVYLVDFIMSLL